MIIVAVLLLLSALLIWRYYSRESRFQEQVQTQGIDENTEQEINAAIEQEVNAAVVSITEEDIENALLGE
jgi:membrane protein implicated in regulation of membrane protease activity